MRSWLYQYLDAAGAGNNGLRGSWIVHKTAIGNVWRTYSPSASSGDFRTLLLSSVSVQFSAVYAPSTDGIESATLLMTFETEELRKQEGAKR